MGVPAKDMAFEKRLEMVEVAGEMGGFWGVDKLLTRVGVAAMSCSMRRKMGSLLNSVLLCIHVPVLMSNSCFFRHKMHTQII